jgi:RimJ/RimL family protein N-acetyltransferase
MEIRLHDDLAAFAELAAPLLHADPVRHTVAVTVLAARLRPGAPQDVRTLLTVHDAGGVCGAALRVGGWPLIASALPVEAAASAAKVLASLDGGAPPAVIGPVANAEAFAGAWCAHTGAVARVRMRQRQFALDELRPPVGVPGAPRLATLDDVELLVRWQHDFVTEAAPQGWPRPENPGELIARQIRHGQGNVLWELGGEPVALAVASAPVVGMSRVAPVWTPPHHRGRGFGSAATAAVSRWALDAGARHVVLFTDLANPVSNSIYPKVGYRPVLDAVELAFE